MKHTIKEKSDGIANFGMTENDSFSSIEFIVGWNDIIVTLFDDNIGLVAA